MIVGHSGRFRKVVWSLEGASDCSLGPGASGRRLPIAPVLSELSQRTRPQPTTPIGAAQPATPTVQHQNPGTIFPDRNPARTNLPSTPEKPFPPAVRPSRVTGARVSALKPCRGQAEEHDPDRAVLDEQRRPARSQSPADQHTRTRRHSETPTMGHTNTHKYDRNRLPGGRTRVTRARVTAVRLSRTVHPRLIYEWDHIVGYPCMIEGRRRA